MRRVVHIIIAILVFAIAANAQPAKRMERVRAIKVAYITDKLQLTTEQSAKFWPIYNRFEEERSDIVRQYRRGGAVETTDEPLRSVDDDIEMQEKILALRKKYKDEFLKVISPKQLAALIEAEREFKKMLLQQLRERRENGGGRRPMR
ncbi:hypothetical protein CAP35_11925 [Chitinophagaceae bacterium IBVUCB1]|nr:hypothetical protein CAP35_11925 [Chitinophagaceae bacterium IBVUCB1]